MNHEFVREGIKTLLKHNPEYEFRFYNNTQMELWIEKFFPEHLNTYLRLNSKFMPARVDFFRYLLMYKVGGNIQGFFFSKQRVMEFSCTIYIEFKPFPQKFQHFFTQTLKLKK